MSSLAPRAGATRYGWLVAMGIIAATGCDRPRAAAPVEVWLAGDVHVGGSPPARGAVAARLAPLAPSLAGVGLVNLEGPVAALRDAPPERIANHPDALAELRAAGVVVAGIANNHAHDAPAHTAAALRAAGIAPAGLDAGVAIVERNGLRIAVAAYDLAAAPTVDELRAARARGDLLIVSLHVLATPSYLPSPATTAAVEAAISAGAAVVAVHGSHAVARVERRGAAVIAWGLGNLLFTCHCTDETDALILRVTLTRAGVGAARVVPIAAGIRGAPATPSPEAALLLDLLRSLGSSPLTASGDF